jgi:hypothetical protein
MSKLPAFWFYPGDWMKDPALRACSPAARGLWMDLICLMWEAPHRGYLEDTEGRPYSAAQLARMTGIHCRVIPRLLGELLRLNIASRNGHDAIYCRRIIRDEDRRKSDAKRQQEHRDLLKANNNGGGSHNNVTPEVTGHVTGVVTSDFSKTSHRLSMASSKASVTKRIKNLPDIPSEYPRQIGDEAANFPLDSGELWAEDAGHARAHATTAHPPEANPAAEAQSADASEAPGEARSKAHHHGGIIASLFAHFLSVCGHDPARYTLTPQRKKKGLLRLQEQIKITGSLAQAVEDLKTAIENLAASEYHVTHGYLDWEAQIFRSREEFEKRLNAKPTPPNTEVSYAPPRFESIEEHNARVMREANARLAHRKTDPNGES